MESNFSCILGQKLFEHSMLRNRTFCATYGLPRNFIIDERILHEVNSRLKEISTAFEPPPPCAHMCKGVFYEVKQSQQVWLRDAFALPFFKKYIKGRSYENHFKILDDIVSQIGDEVEVNSTLMDRISSVKSLRQNFVKVKVKIRSMLVKKQEETPLVGIGTVVGSIGGILNLWLGVSFITLVEIIEVLIKYINRCFKSDRDSGRDLNGTSAEDSTS